MRDDTIGATTYSDHPHVATTLGDYRDKYALYRSDKSLRKLHAQAPMVVIWDDHEVQNNYAGGDPDGGLPADELYSATRREAGYKAWFESMPTYAGKDDRIFRRLKFGKTMDLIMLDQRQYRDDQPCDDAVVARRAPSWTEPRDLLGRKQMKWAKQQLSVLQGRLEGRRQRGDDDARQGARRLLLHVRLLAGLPDRARGAARPHQGQGRSTTSSSSRATSTRSSPATSAPQDGAGETVATRVRRRLDHLAEPRRDEPRRGRRRDHPRQRRRTRTPRRR